MTLQQGIEIAQMAKSKGYALRAHNGLVQFVTYEPATNTVTPRTEFMTYQQAKQLILEAGAAA